LDSLIVVSAVDSTSIKMPEEKRPPVCDYEGSDYQTRFWEKGGREYEDRCEAIALQRLLPPRGDLLLELGAGAGRNTQRYGGFGRIILLDYSRTQLKQAQERLGRSERFIYVAADIYRLPFINGLFDAATMIRVLHHMADAPAALNQVRNILKSGGIFILEYANKRNFKAIFRYIAGNQKWNPFSLDPVEFAPLNYDFHPKAIRKWLSSVGFEQKRVLTVSHFRVNLLKRQISPAILAGLDSILQWTGAFCKLTPSVFVRAEAIGGNTRIVKPTDTASLFKCPVCNHSPLISSQEKIGCPSCRKEWQIVDGIYDFRGK
jgi:ubiquinone/menaquinone biosynthesis C-methylase UbiE